jgi:hypothetical protein
MFNDQISFQCFGPVIEETIHEAFSFKKAREAPEVNNKDGNLDQMTTIDKSSSLKPTFEKSTFHGESLESNLSSWSHSDCSTLNAKSPIFSSSFELIKFGKFESRIRMKVSSYSATPLNDNKIYDKQLKTCSSDDGLCVLGNKMSLKRTGMPIMRISEIRKGQRLSRAVHRIQSQIPAIINVSLRKKIGKSLRKSKISAFFTMKNLNSRI